MTIIPLGIQEGNVCKVIINDTSYVSVAYKNEYDEVMLGTNSETEPYCIYVYPDGFTFSPLAGDGTYKVTIIYDKVHTQIIDDKFLPVTLYQTTGEEIKKIKGDLFISIDPEYWDADRPSLHIQDRMLYVATPNWFYNMPKPYKLHKTLGFSVNESTWTTYMSETVQIDKSLIRVLTQEPAQILVDFFNSNSYLMSSCKNNYAITYFGQLLNGSQIIDCLVSFEATEKTYEVGRPCKIECKLRLHRTI